jgi:hypothetical protein
MKKNPVAKAVRTPRFKIQIVKSKKLYDRKKSLDKNPSRDFLIFKNK